MKSSFIVIYSCQKRLCCHHLASYNSKGKSREQLFKMFHSEWLQVTSCLKHEIHVGKWRHMKMQNQNKKILL